MKKRTLTPTPTAHTPQGGQAIEQVRSRGWTGPLQATPSI